MSIELLVLLGRSCLMCLNHTSRGQAGKKGRIDSILDSIVDMAASSDGSSTSDSIHNSVVFAGVTNLASDPLCLAVLG